MYIKIPFEIEFQRGFVILIKIDQAERLIRVLDGIGLVPGTPKNAQHKLKHEDKIKIKFQGPQYGPFSGNTRIEVSRL